MRIKFWGTRGTRPTPGRRTLRYGANRTCVEVRDRLNNLVIINSGGRPPSESLLESFQQFVRTCRDRPLDRAVPSPGEQLGVVFGTGDDVGTPNQRHRGA